jgi:hypothetical protein
MNKNDLIDNIINSQTTSLSSSCFDLRQDKWYVSNITIEHLLDKKFAFTNCSKLSKVNTLMKEGYKQVIVKANTKGKLKIDKKNKKVKAKTTEFTDFGQGDFTLLDLL